MSRVAGTLQSVVLMIAEGLGIEDLTTDSNGVALCPTQPHDLDRCVRLFNEAQIRLVNEYPRWRCLLPTRSVTLDPDGTGPQNIDSDASKYALADDVRGNPIGIWTWRYEAGNYGGTAKVTNPDRVRALLASDTSTGQPQMIAVDQVRSSTASAGKLPLWGMQVYPTPDVAYVVTARFRIEAMPLRELTDRHVWGLGMEHVLSQVAIAIGEKQEPNADLIRKAIRNDLDNANGSHGQMTDPGVCDEDEMAGVVNREPISYNGVQIN